MKIAAKVAPNENELNTVVEAGYKYVEIYTNKRYIDKKCAKLLNNFRERFGLEYVIHAPTDSLDRSVIEFAKNANVKNVVVHNVLKISEMKELVDLAESFGIQLCVEHWGNHYLGTLEEFFAIKKQIPKIKLAVDIEHAIINNVFPEIIIRAGKDIGHVHMTGYPPTYHSPPFQNMEVNKTAIEELRKVGYKGFIVAEMDLKYQTKDNFEKTKKFMEEIAGKIAKT